MSAPSVIYNNTDLILPLDPPRHSVRDYFNPSLPGTPFPKISLFLLLCGIPRLKSLQKVHFVVFTIAHTIYLTTTCMGSSLDSPTSVLGL